MNILFKPPTFEESPHTWTVVVARANGSAFQATRPMFKPGCFIPSGYSEWMRVAMKDVGWNANDPLETWTKVGAELLSLLPKAWCQTWHSTSEWILSFPAPILTPYPLFNPFLAVRGYSCPYPSLSIPPQIDPDARCCIGFEFNSSC